jgi:hypothetical protein
VVADWPVRRGAEVSTAFLYLGASSAALDSPVEHILAERLRLAPEFLESLDLDAGYLLIS